MPRVDTRQPTSFREINELLLKVSNRPRDYVSALDDIHKSMPQWEVVHAARLGRQASAEIICNCVMELWSHTVYLLHGLEPVFPLYPRKVSNFVKDTRLSFLSYLSILFCICNEPFEGTSMFNNIRIVLDLRHDLQHDKPEDSNEYSEGRIERIAKWRKRLEPLVGKDAILWLPQVRAKQADMSFSIGGEPPVMKFMKYPIAKWAHLSTLDAISQMDAMFYKQKGKIKLAAEGTPLIEIRSTINNDEELSLLWGSGT